MLGNFQLLLRGSPDWNLSAAECEVLYVKKLDKRFPLEFNFGEREPFVFEDTPKLRTFLGQGHSKQSHGGGGSPCDCLEFLTSLCLLCLNYTIRSLCKHDVLISSGLKQSNRSSMYKYLKAAGSKGAVRMETTWVVFADSFSVPPLHVDFNCSCCWRFEGPRPCFFTCVDSTCA